MIGDVKIKRFVLCEVSHGILNIEVHSFADSSMQAYASVIYLRIQTKLGIRVSLLASKSKVAPINKTSIPRLELLACMLLVKLLAEVLPCVPQTDTCKKYGWSDSMVALWWIREKVKCWWPCRSSSSRR